MVAIFTFLLGGGLLVAGVALLAASTVEPDQFKSYLDHFGNRGDSHLSLDTITHLARLLRLAGALICGGGVAVLILSKRIIPRATPMAVSARQSLGAMLHRATTELRSAGALACGYVCVATIAALALRLRFLNSPMRVDESQTYVFYASKPLFIGLSNYAEPNNHLFHTLLAHLSLMMLGDQPWSLRLPAFLSGVAMVPLTFIVALRSAGRSAGVLAATLVATSSYLIDYSTNARGYTLQADLLLIALFCAQELRTRWSSAAIIGFAVSSALGFWAIPTMLYAFASMVMWIIVSYLLGDVALSRRQFITALAAIALLTIGLTAILYMPVFVARGPSAVTHNGCVAPIAVAELRENLHAMAAEVWRLWFRDLPWGVVIALSTLMWAGICAQIAGRVRIAAERVPFVLVAVLTCGVCIAAQRVAPFARVWTMLMPPVYIAIGVGFAIVLSRIGRSAQAKSIAAVILSAIIGIAWGGAVIAHPASILAAPGTDTMPGGRAAIVWAIEHRQPNDRLLALGNAGLPTLYYVLHSPVSIDYIYFNPTPLPGRAIILQCEPRSPLSKALAFLRVNNPSLSDPVLLGDFGDVHLWEVHAAPPPH